MVLFEIEQRFKGHFFNELGVSFNGKLYYLCSVISRVVMIPYYTGRDVMLLHPVQLTSKINCRKRDF